MVQAFPVQQIGKTCFQYNILVTRISSAARSDCEYDNEPIEQTDTCFLFFARVSVRALDTLVFLRSRSTVKLPNGTVLL